MSYESLFIPLVVTLSLLLLAAVLLAVLFSPRLRDHGQLVSTLIFAALAFNVLSWINGISSSCRISESECIGATASAFLFVVPAFLIAYSSMVLVLRHRHSKSFTNPNQPVAGRI